MDSFLKLSCPFNNATFRGFKIRNSILPWFVFLFALGVGIYSQYPAFQNHYVLNDDFKINIYWMQQFYDQDLFQDDLLTKYAKSFQPITFVLFYRVCAFFMNPMTTSKILPLFLLPISTVYLFRLVRKIGGDYAGLLSSFLFVISPRYIASMVGGYPRGFIYPLLIPFLYYLVKERYGKASCLMVLQVLVYPLIFLLCFMTFLFAMILKPEARRMLLTYPKNVIVIVCFVLCMTILSVFYLKPPDPEIGVLVNKEDIIGNAEYYSGGRHELMPLLPVTKTMYMLFGASILNPFRRYDDRLSRTFSVFKVSVMILVLLIFVLLVIRFRLSYPMELIYFLTAGILMYQIASFYLLKFYVPERYMRYALPIVILISISLAIDQLMKRIHYLRLRKWIQTVVLIFIVSHVSQVYGITLQDNSSDVKLYQYLSRLPKSALIAAHPYTAEWIPTYSKRKVFVNAELSDVWYKSYWRAVKQRNFDLLDAYYSVHIQDVYDFSKENGVDYFVVDKKHFSYSYLKRNWFYFEPFNTYIAELVRNRHRFALMEIPKQKRLFEHRGLFVVKTEDLR